MHKGFKDKFDCKNLRTLEEVSAARIALKQSSERQRVDNYLGKFDLLITGFTDNFNKEA
jgi:hypothetical protein